MHVPLLGCAPSDPRRKGVVVAWGGGTASPCTGSCHGSARAGSGSADGGPTTRVYEGGAGEERSGNHPSTNRSEEPRRVVSYRHTDPNALTPDSLLATLSQLESRPPEVGSRPSTSRRRIGQAAARTRP